MKEITGCAICAEKYNRHIEAYGKVSREEYDTMRDEAKRPKQPGPTYWQNVYLLDDEHGAIIARIETYCSVCKDKKIYEGTVVEVSDDK